MITEYDLCKLLEKSQTFYAENLVSNCRRASKTKECNTIHLCPSKELTYLPHSKESKGYEEFQDSLSEFTKETEEYVLRLHTDWSSAEYWYLEFREEAGTNYVAIEIELKTLDVDIVELEDLVFVTLENIRKSNLVRFISIQSIADRLETLQ